ncbi:MAG: hypothetical protein AAF512_15855, partial [Pseudomonadota bacterium]
YGATYFQPRDERAAMIRGVINQFGQLVPDDNLVIKLTSINVIRMSSYFEAYPNMPWVFMFRHPIEIMVSIMRTATGWSNSYGHSEAPGLLGLEPEHLEGVSFEEYLALGLRQMFDKALQRDNGNGLFIDYAALAPDTFATVAQHFGIEVDETDLHAMNNVLGTYSKDSSRQREPNPDDSIQKRSEASAAITAAAELAEASYHALVARAGR